MIMLAVFFDMLSFIHVLTSAVVSQTAMEVGHGRVITYHIFKWVYLLISVLPFIVSPGPYRMFPNAIATPFSLLDKDIVQGWQVYGDIEFQTLQWRHMSVIRSQMTGYSTINSTISLG